MGMSNSGSFLLGVIAVIGIIFGGWLYVNYQPTSIGGTFLVLSIIGLVVAVLNRPIAAYFGGGGDAGGTDLRYKTQLILGGILGFIPIILSLAFSLSISTPALNVQQNILFVVVVIAAPIIEELFFLFVVPFLLGNVLRRYGLFGFGANVLLSSLIFALYHWLAYGAVFGASPEFIGAFTFRLITLVLVAVLARSTSYTPSTVGKGIIAAIIMHSMFNGFVQAKSLFIVAESVV